MTTRPAPDIQPPNAAGPGPTPAPAQKSITIGVVCKSLVQEFPDISISKIRYLEDQKLLTPRRTSGGYRLYSPTDVARLRTILRLQRDEFLPLRVIRQELAAGRDSEPDTLPTASPADSRRRWRPTVAVTEALRRVCGGGSVGCRLTHVYPDGAAPYFTVIAPARRGDVVESTQADPRLIAELEDYGVIKGEKRGGVICYDDTEREIIRAVTELARYGVGGRNLRVFRSSADREASLLQQILEPALRSRNPQRRREAVEALENLAAVATHLKHLLLIRDLRKLAN